MIHEVSGDILLTKAAAIAHGVAPNDHFDHGLALSLREKWPAMVKAYRHYVSQTHPKPGEMWTWGVNDFAVFNLMTQEGEHGHGARPGKSSLPNVNHCLKRLRHAIETDHVRSVALPKLATGVGALEWSEVLPLVRTHLGDLHIPVYVYMTYHKDVAADEAGAQDRPVRHAS